MNPEKLKNFGQSHQISSATMGIPKICNLILPASLSFWRHNHRWHLDRGDLAPRNRNDVNIDVTGCPTGDWWCMDRSCMNLPMLINYAVII